MWFRRFMILMFFGMLMLASLACGLPDNVAEIAAPALETAEGAAQEAGNVAQTAAAQASELAGTAAVMATTEGSGVVASVKTVTSPGVDSLKERVANIEPDADGNYRVTLGEDEVNTVLRLRQLLSGDIIGAGIQSQEMKFRDGAILLTGSILEPIPGQLTVRMRPAVFDGQFQLDIMEASVASQTAPQETLEAAEGAINSTLGEALAFLPDGVKLREITAFNGELTITGRKTEG